MSNLGQFEVIDFRTGMSGGSPNQYSRSFAIHANERQLDELMRNTHGGDIITANTIAASSSIIGMSSDARSMINMEGGWDAQRCICFLTVRNNASGDIYILTGYTSVDFMSSDGSIHGHGIVSFTSYNEFTAGRNNDGALSYRSTTKDSLLTKQYVSNSEYDNVLYTRPKDVLTAASVHELAGSGGGTFTTDQLYGCSSASNAIASSWLGRGLTALTDARIGMIGGVDDFAAPSGASMTADAGRAAMVNENVGSRHPLLGSIISGIYSESSMEVTWNELISKLPGLRNHLTQAPQNAGGGNVQNFDQWNDRNASMVFSELASAIPALLLHLGIAAVRFQITNANTGMDSMFGNRPKLAFDSNNERPSVSFMLQDIDQQDALRKFEAALCVDIFPRLCNGHKVSVTVDASAISQMIISCDYDGYHSNFSSPTFAHARWSVISGTSEGQHNLSTGLAAVADHISDTANGVVNNKQSFGQSTNTSWDSPSY